VHRQESFFEACLLGFACDLTALGRRHFTVDALRPCDPKTGASVQLGYPTVTASQPILIR